MDSNAGNWINASRQAPNFLLFKRNDRSSIQRTPRCCHYMKNLTLVTSFKNKRRHEEYRCRLIDKHRAQRLHPSAHNGPALEKTLVFDGPGGLQALRRILGRDIV